MFCLAHVPKNFFARFARDPPSGGSAFGRVGVMGVSGPSHPAYAPLQRTNVAPKLLVDYCSASRARLEIIFRRSPKKSFALHGRSKSEISTGFFLTARRRELSPSAAGQAPEPQAKLGEVDLKVDRTLAFQVTIAIVSSTACPHIIPLMIQIS